MSEKPISKGDLVIIIKPLRCCHATRRIGQIFEVERIQIGTGLCADCGRSYPVTAAWVKGDNYAVPTEMLKRLDPGNLSQDIPADNEVTA